MNASDLVKVWDEAVRSFLTDGLVPEELQAYRDSYRGKGECAVDAQAMPEPYLGDLTGEPSAVVLALNPGASNARFQHRGGIFAREIREMGSYSAWAASTPYSRNPWEAKIGTNRHHARLLRFVRDLRNDQTIQSDSIVAMELYPWHSKRFSSGALRLDPHIVRDFVLEPAQSLKGQPPIVALGADWVRYITDHADDLGLNIERRFGPREDQHWPGTSKTRTVLVARTDSGSPVIGHKQQGSGGPPGRKETLVLRDTLSRLL